MQSIARVTDEIAVVVGYDGAVLRTPDAGRTWNEIDAGCDTTFRGVDFADEFTGMAVGDFGVVRRTDDGGLTWSPLATGAAAHLYDVACLDADHAVAVGWGRTILYTSDGGISWQERQGGDGFDYHQAVFFIDDLYGWTSTFYGDVWHTADGGLNWEKQVDTFLDLQDITFSDRRHGISVGGVDGNATLLTDDGGLTWTEQANPDNAYLNGVALRDSVTGIAVGQGIFRTFDGAVTWERDFAYSVFFDDVCHLGGGVALAVGQGGAILRAGPDGVSLVREGPPRAMAGINVYPNPFNPVTNIVFSLPRSQMVRIGIFDVSGRTVRTLAARAFAEGDHSLEWDGRDRAGRCLASGSYLVRLETEAAAYTRKVMLVK